MNIEGTNGNDLLQGTEENDTLSGLDGNDTLETSISENDVLSGGNGADIFVLNKSDNNSRGEDTFTTTILDFDRGEGDRIDVSQLGISSFATLSQLLSTDSDGNTVLSTFDSGDENIVIVSGVSEFTPEDFIFDETEQDPNIIGTRRKDDLFGGLGDDTLIDSDLLGSGFIDNDRLFGEAGNDVLEIGVGDDSLFGGTGADTFVLNNSDNNFQSDDTFTATIFDFARDEGDRIDLRKYGIGSFESISELTLEPDANGNARLSTFINGDENILVVEGIGEFIQSDFIFDEQEEDSSLVGTFRKDDLFGGLGNDTIEGDSGTVRDRGNDRLFGEVGDDELIGGVGDDSLFGGDGKDTAVFSGASSEYQVTTDEAGVTTVENLSDRNEGTDFLVDIETIRFNNEQIQLEDSSIPQPPSDDNESIGELVGQVGSIEIFITSPTTIAANGTDEVVVTYRNIGNTSVEAPLLNLSADGALLRPSDAVEFEETSIQFLAINNEGEAGILTPGASNSFRVDFTPDTTDTVNFTVSSVEENTEIDWESLRESSRPEYITPAAWNEIYDNFLAEVGTTVEDYEQLLIDNANYLSNIGEYVSEADSLLAFEFQQASDFSTIAQRYSLGSFGRGRSFIGDIELSTDAEGNIFIDNTAIRRTFNLLEDGTYQGQTGDFATVSLNDGIYTLTEADGTATVFNSNGRVDYIEDTNGNRLDAEYTEGQLSSLRDAFGNSLNFEYNGDSRIITVTDSDDRVTNYEYDATGELLTAVTDEAGTTTYTYDGVALASISDPNGTTIEFEYDDRGRLTQQSITGENAAIEVLNYSYGDAGEVTVTDANGNPTELLLNENGQVGQLRDANDRLINFSYDNQGNLTQLDVPGDNNTLFGYDESGNLTSQVDAEDNITTFTYEDTFNQLTGFTDSLGNGINYSYDDSGNLTAITYEDGSSETFEYNDNGDVTVSVNRRGQEILYSYNDRGQLTSQINPDADTPIEYIYDERGNLETVSDGNGTIDLDYDLSDRLIKITYPEGRFLEYTYDAGGRRTSMSEGDGNTVNYGYDQAGRLASMSDGNGDLIISYQYDDVGRLAREDKGNDTYTEYSYDLAGQLLSITNYAPDGTINSSSIYTYDQLGRQTSLTTLDGEWTYGYDATGQLTEADFVSTNPDISDRSLTYEYDAVGNRLTTTENGVSTDYTTNNLNQYVDVNGFEYQYDDDGNLVSQTTDGGTFLYGYNSENQLVSVTSPEGTLTTYEYDPFGNRIASVADGERTEYLIDPFGFGDVVGEYDGDGNLIASYTHGLGLESIINPDASYYYDFNANGSTVGLTDANGGVVNSYFYDPFGNDILETEAVANSYEFVGQFGVAEESNGLDFMRARFYDSNTGRFISPDPIGLLGNDINLYRYVGNIPILFSDPAGLFFPGYSSDYIDNAPNLTGLSSEAAQYVIQRSQQPNIIYALEDFSKDVGNFLSDVGRNTKGYFISAGKIILSQENLKAISNISSVLGSVTGALSIASLAIPGVGTVPAASLIALKNTFEGIGTLASLTETALYSQTPTGDYAKTLVNIKLNKVLPFPLDATSDPSGILQDSVNTIIDTVVDKTPIGRSSTEIPNINSEQQIPSPAENQARSKGEPHLTTFDGVGYDFQAAGEFTLVESLDGEFDVQVRYVRLNETAKVTVASAVATKVEGQEVVIDAGGIGFDANGDAVVTREGDYSPSIFVDGEAVEIASGGSLDLGNSRIYRRGGEVYTIVYAGEDGVISDGDDQLVVDFYRPGIINYVDVYFGDEQQEQITGLLGNLNGNPDDDVAFADGTPLPRPLAFEQLYGAYRDDYRIKTIDESFFTYEDGQNPNTFFIENFPTEPFTYDDLSPEARARGNAAALEAGFEPGTYAFKSAAFDFAVTNDPGFLESSDTDPDAEEVEILAPGETPSDDTDSEAGVGNLELTISGESYLGIAPKFRVTVDGEVIADNLEALETQTFAFEIPGLTDDSAIQIEYLNDDAADNPDNGDRNLIVDLVVVNDSQLNLSQGNYEVVDKNFRGSNILFFNGILSFNDTNPQPFATQDTPSESSDGNIITGEVDTGSLEYLNYSVIINGGEVLEGTAAPDIFQITTGEGSDEIINFEDNIDTIELVNFGSNNLRLYDGLNGAFIQTNEDTGIFVSGITAATLADDIALI